MVMTQAVTECRASYKSLQQDNRFVDNSHDAATQINPDSLSEPTTSGHIKWPFCHNYSEILHV